MGSQNLLTINLNQLTLNLNPHTMPLNPLTMSPNPPTTSPNPSITHPNPPTTSPNPPIRLASTHPFMPSPRSRTVSSTQWPTTTHTPTSPQRKVVWTTEALRAPTRWRYLTEGRSTSPMWLTRMSATRLRSRTKATQSSLFPRLHTHM